MCDRIVRDETPIQSNRLSIEEIGQGLIGRTGIPERAGGQRKAAHEVFVQLPIHAEANADTGSIAVGNAVLVVILTPDPNVSAETEPACQGLKRREFPMRVLLAAVHCGELSFEV